MCAWVNEATAWIFKPCLSISHIHSVSQKRNKIETKKNVDLQKLNTNSIIKKKTQIEKHLFRELRFFSSVSCKETPNRSARQIFFWILKAGDPHQQHPLQAAATMLFESSPYFMSESTMVIEGWSEASSVCSSSSSSSRQSGGHDSSSSSVTV